MLGKILFFILLLVMVWALWNKRRQVGLDQKKVKEPLSKKMIQCPICGVHFAEVDGLWHNGKSYCSNACLDIAQHENSSN